jgi:hypothetical protein
VWQVCFAAKDVWIPADFDSDSMHALRT